MKKMMYIICVDDEKIVLDSLQSQLRRNFGETFHYEFAESANEALEIIEDIYMLDEEIIYVVISDWLMPGMKGDELLHEIKQKVKRAKTILLTGHTDSAVIRELEQQHQEITVIFKPWNEGKLMNLIHG
jgi:DNA-binding NtrC family response regulator